MTMSTITSIKTPIVCGTCTAINYRETELTCKKCGDYFPTKAPTITLPKKSKLDKSSIVTLVAGTMVASLAGSAVLAFTLVLGSFM